MAGLTIGQVEGGATLTLNYTGAGQAGTSRTLDLVLLTAAFDPVTTTFNNYSNSSTDPRLNPGMTVLDSFTGDFSESTGQISFAISGSTLTDWINNPGTNYGVGVFMATEDRGDVYFASSRHESIAGPSLTLIPEPSSYAALFGALALVGVCARRRR